MKVISSTQMLAQRLLKIRTVARIRPSAVNGYFHLSTSTQVKEKLAKKIHEEDYEQEMIEDYEAPYSFTLQVLKKVSLTSSGVGLLLTPMFLSFGAHDKISLMAGCIVAGTLAVTGLTSTAALHLCFSPYIHHLVYDKDSETFHVEKMNLLSRKYYESFQLKDMEASTGFNPFANFQANGKKYFAHEALRLYPFMPEFHAKLKTIGDLKRKSKPRPRDEHDESVL